MKKPPFDLNSLARALHNGAHRDLNSMVRRENFSSEAKPEPGERVFDLNATPQEYDYVCKCMARMRDTLRDHVGEKAANGFDDMTAAMDLIVCHRNVCALNLFQLLTSSDDDFTHDVFGIGLHMDRKSGTLKFAWRPRCAKATS